MLKIISFPTILTYYEEYEMLSYYNSIDASRRHKTTESEIKDVITHSNGSNQSIRTLEPRLP